MRFREIRRLAVFTAVFYVDVFLVWHYLLHRDVLVSLLVPLIMVGTSTAAVFATRRWERRRGGT